MKIFFKKRKSKKFLEKKSFMSDDISYSDLP